MSSTLVSKSAKCSFVSCSSSIITLDNDSQIVTLPSDAYELFRIMELKDFEELVNDKFYAVGDIWDFDNVGVSKNIPTEMLSDLSKSNITFIQDGTEWTITELVKYLICADCDKGPIGLVVKAKSNNDNTERDVNLLSLKSVQLH